MKSHPGVALAFLVIVAAGTLVSHRAGAQRTPQVRQAVDVCRTAAAGASLTFGPTATELTNRSAGPTYGSGDCGRYVVDIAVGQSQPVSQFGNTFGFWGTVAVIDAFTSVTCPGLGVDVSYYKKAAGQSAFTRIGGGKLQGHWVSAGSVAPAHCELEREAGFRDPGHNLAYPSAGTDVYRVAAAATSTVCILGGCGPIPQPVEVGVSRTPQPN